MEISNLSDAEFKTLVIRMLKELSEYLSGIKKTQQEMKNNLQGNNSKVDEAKNQINDLENTGREKQPIRRRRKKKAKKKKRIV